jgi:hypothetical protein
VIPFDVRGCIHISLSARTRIIIKMAWLGIIKMLANAGAGRTLQRVGFRSGGRGFCQAF